MKNKIKPFIQNLIKENILYILGNIFIFFLLIITIIIGFSEILDYNKKVAELRIELKQLENKITLLNTVVPSSEKLEENLIFLNILIPNTEDYFSIIYSLEKLSQKSNFIISSYNVIVGQSTAEKLKLSVTGSGDNESFVEFLQNYNFGGGRLITSDKIRLDKDNVGSVQIDLTFYTKAVSTTRDLEIVPDEKIFKNLESLKNKVNFIVERNLSSETLDLDYPKKSNPF